MKGVDLVQLRYFLALAEELNFTRAAHRCDVTQQTLSAAIARLESALGLRLVERTTRRVALTPAGTALREHAQRALAILDQGIAGARRAEATAAPLRVACVLDVQVALEERLAAFSGSALSVTLGTEPDVVADLKGGRADLALLWNPGPAAHDLPHRTLTHERLVAVVPAGHRLAARPVLHPEELGAEPFVLFDRRHAPAVYDAFVRQILPPDADPVIVHSPVIDNSHRSRAAAVASGLGVTAVVARAAARLPAPGLAVRPVEPPIYLETTAAWRHPPSPAATALVAYLCAPPEG